MKEFFRLKNFNLAAVVLAAVTVALFIFYLGLQVGFRKAEFSRAWGENYARNFGGPRGEGFMVKIPDDQMIGGHGTFGQIVRIKLPELVVHNPEEAEKIVVVGDETLIRRYRDSIEAAELQVGEMVVVIGTPNASGSVVAKLIRILPPPPDQNIASSTDL